MKIAIPLDTGDFRLMSRRAVHHLRQLREKDRFVRGLVSWLGFKQVGVYYARDKRYAGVTKFPFKKMLKLAFDGITSFSNIPLKMATWLGYCASLVAFLYACSVLVQKALGYTVLEVAPAFSIDEIRKNMRRFAEAVGEMARGGGVDQGVR